MQRFALARALPSLLDARLTCGSLLMGAIKTTPMLAPVRGLRVILFLIGSHELKKRMGGAPAFPLGVGRGF